MAEPTLGELIAAALGWEDPPGPPPAITIKEVANQAERMARRAMLVCGNTLADDLAPLFNSTADEVFESLGHVPDAMLEHLKTPQGWTILAGEVAADLRCPIPAYAPTVH